MGSRWIVASKVLVHLACLLPVAWVAWGLYRDTLGADPISYVTHFTGFGALRLLVISLAVTPVRKLLPKLAWLIRFRRLLGLYAFFYASLHLLIYVGLFSGCNWGAMADDLKERPYIWAGVASWAMLLPLALTSTKASIRALGKRWAWLHRLAYLAAVAGVMHYWWIVKKGVLSPVTLTLVLAVLLLARPLLSRWDVQRRTRRVAGAAG
jgi:sulfoxide reductase heme-binding subunit YedZ